MPDDRIDAKEESGAGLRCEFRDAFLFPGTSALLGGVACALWVWIQLKSLNDLLNLPGRHLLAVVLAIENSKLHLRVAHVLAAQSDDTFDLDAGERGAAGTVGPMAAI